MWDEESVNINAEHPPNQKEPYKGDRKVADPLTGRLGIAKIEHAQS
jgi:hypothetical protein